MPLTNQVIIITGASSGIGAATALAAAREGMDVVLNARRIEKLTRVAELVEQLGRRAEIVSGDVTDPGVSQRLLDVAEERLGRFDVVFANAGYGMPRAILDYSDEELRKMFEVNLFASADLLRHAARRLQDAGRHGHLLMCSSCVAKFTMPHYGVYSSTKAAQAHLCRALRYELRASGIEVSSVHPVTTSTEFFETAARHGGLDPNDTDLDHTPSIFVQPPERVARAIIRCLRHPTSEVWTSHMVRLAAGIVTAFPFMIDWWMFREAKRRTLPAPRENADSPVR